MKLRKFWSRLGTEKYQQRTTHKAQSTSDNHKQTYHRLVYLRRWNAKYTDEIYRQEQAFCYDSIYTVHTWWPDWLQTLPSMHSKTPAIYATNSMAYRNIILLYKWMSQCFRYTIAHNTHDIYREIGQEANVLVYLLYEVCCELAVYTVSGAAAHGLSSRMGQAQ